MTRSKIRWVAQVGLALMVWLVALTTSANVSAQEAGSADEKLVLRVGTTSDLNTDNPFKSCCTSDYEFLFLNYDMLLSFGQEDLRAAPGLAEGCTPSSDSMTWTCTIRDGVKWQDGVPFTSHDVAFTYEFILNNGSAGALYKNYLPYDPTFETPDDHTLIWKSSQPTFAPIVPVWAYIMPEHIWSQYDGEDPKTIKSAPNTPAIGTGPFQLVEWEPGQFFRMEANQNYWGGAPAVDEIVFKVFDNQEAMVNELKAGELDVIDDVNATLFNSLEGVEDVETRQSISDWWPSLAFNFGGQGPDATNLPALGDVRVRQAIAHAIDKQRIADSVYQGLAAPGDTVVRPASAYWHLDIPPEEEFAFDPDEARRFLDEAGYVDTDGDGVREDPSSGEPLELQIPVVTNTLGAVDVSKLVEPWLEDVGFDVEMRPMTESRVLEAWETGDFDAYIWYWSGDPDPDFIMSIFLTDQCLGWSDGCYSDPTYDAMYEGQRATLDPELRKAKIDEMQRYIYDQVPVLALAYPKILEAYRTDRFTGWTPAPGDDGPVVFGYGNWTYLNLRPVASSAGDDAGGSGGGGTPVGVWIGIGALVLLGAGWALLRRRRDDEGA